MAREALRAELLLLECKEGDKLRLMFQFDLYREPHLLFRSMELEVLRHEKTDGGFHDIAFASTYPFLVRDGIPTNLRFHEPVFQTMRCMNLGLIAGDKRVNVVDVFDASKFNTGISLDDALLDVDTEVHVLAQKAKEKANRIKEAVERYRNSKRALENNGDSERFRRFYGYRPVTRDSVEPSIAEANENLTKFADENAIRIIGRFFKQ